MKILSCKIGAFGKLKDKVFDFGEGLNKIVGENGAGKTTLSVFIKAMLYGIGDTKKTSLEENDRKHYLPWDSGSGSGALEFSVNGKSYRVERSFGAKASEDSFALFDLKTGKPSSDYSERLGEELFGIDAEGFEETVFLSERNLTPTGENKSVSAKLGGLVGCDGDMGAMDDALKRLEDERKKYSKRGGGEIADITSRISEGERKLLMLKEKEEELKKEAQRLYELRNLIKENEARSAELSKKKESAILMRADRIEADKIGRMQTLLSETQKKLADSAALFKSEIPSLEEVNEMSLKAAEAKRLDKPLPDPTPEFAEMRRRFGRVDKECADRAKAGAKRLRGNREKAKMPDAQAFLKTFKARIPDGVEIEELIIAEGKKPRGGAMLSSLVGLGLLLAVIGGLLGFILTPVLFVITGIGVVLTLCAILGTLLRKKRAKTAYKKRVSDFFLSVGGEAYSGEDSAAALREAARLLSRKAELAPPDETEDTEALKEFLSYIEDPEEGDVLEVSEALLVKWEQYASLDLLVRLNNSREERDRERAKALLREVGEFLDRYGLKDEANPFLILRNRVNEYNSLKRQESDRRAELEMASVNRRSGPQNLAEVTVSENDIAKDIMSLENERRDLQRSAALSERRVTELNYALEEREDLVMMLEELREKLAEGEERLRIIQLTKQLLLEAKDLMTARYLGKTKESFKKYSELISGNRSDGLDMDTEFNVTRLDGGRSRKRESYSKGTRELYSLSSRLALIDSLYGENQPPVILDDPFASFDDEKTKRALSLLRELGKSRQIIYFTCSESRSLTV